MNQSKNMVDECERAARFLSDYFQYLSPKYKNLSQLLSCPIFCMIVANYRAQPLVHELTASCLQSSTLAS